MARSLNDCEEIVISEGSEDEKPVPQIDRLKTELGGVERKIADLEKQKLSINRLLATYRPRADELRKEISSLKTKRAGNKNWAQENYPWSEQVKKLLRSVFKFNDFKFAQLSAINAVLSKKDLIVIMPTGGGKSLTYQLPALVNKGITVVISPLISLITDQLRHLQELNIKAVTINSSNSSKVSNAVYDALAKGVGNVKIVYVTPEWLAKSKRFMSNLQKAHERGAIDLIAIDEVHCCSLWGHDFRPDYKNLHIFKSIFPQVPIIGVTATATEKVIRETQELLGIQGCLVLRAPYNRPNLIYSVQKKPGSLKESAEYLFTLIKQRFPNDTGIVYTHSINDSVDLAVEFRKLGLNCAPYHAMMENDKRDEVHRKWTEKKYQLICATVAFGMGIDKPDVRFVIHHSLPKSMENYYQESGRAGRDGKEAECILLYSIRDIFRVSGLVATSSQNGVKYLYEVVKYCLEPKKCRRSMIAVHFDEKWEKSHCGERCDNCNEKNEAVRIDVRKCFEQLVEIIENARTKSDTNLTILKLMDAWFQVGGSKKLRLPNVSPPKMTREFGEKILAHLIVNGYLKENLHFTAYTTISYIGKGHRNAEKNVFVVTPRSETPRYMYSEKDLIGSGVEAEPIAETAKRPKSPSPGPSSGERRDLTDFEYLEGKSRNRSPSKCSKSGGSPKSKLQVFVHSYNAKKSKEEKQIDSRRSSCSSTKMDSHHEIIYSNSPQSDEDVFGGNDRSDKVQRKRRKFDRAKLHSYSSSSDSDSDYSPDNGKKRK